MARRRRKVSRARTRTRTVYKTRRSKKGMGQTTKLLLSSVGYGVLREPISQLARKIPFTAGLSDEALLAGAGALANWKGTGFIKAMGKSALMIEAHNLGRSGFSGFQGLLGGSSSGVTSSASTTGATF